MAALTGLPVVGWSQFTYSEDFKNATAPGWNFYQDSSGTSPGPRLTSGATPVSGDPEFTAGAAQIDPSGQGWLRLATANNNQSNAVFFDTPIPSAGNRVTVSFSANLWGGTGADGLTMFLYDASKTFSPGAFGGSMGYANRDGTIDGLAGAYVAVGLDAFGNFSNPIEGRNGGVGFVPNAVVVRGPDTGGVGGQDGYDYLAGTSGNGIQGRDFTDTGDPVNVDAADGVMPTLPYQMQFTSASARPNQSTQYRRVEATLDENNQFIVRMQFGEDGLWRDLLNVDLSSFTRPEQLRIGFTGGTGGSTGVYEVGGLLRIDATAGTETFMWDNDEGPSSQVWGTSVTNPQNWFGNTNPTLKTNIVFNSAYINQAQNIDLRGSDKVITNLYFAGPDAYSLFTTESRRLIFDSKTAGGLTTLSLTADPAGDTSHQIGVNILMNQRLDVNNNVTPTFTISGNIDNGGNALGLKGFGTTVISGAISGTGTLDKSDSGTAILSGANTYSGNTTVSGGVLRIESAAALGSTAAGTTVSSGGTLAFGGTGTTFAAESLTLNGTGFASQGALLNAAGNNTLTGTVSLASDSSIGAAANTTLTLNGVVSGTAATNDLVKVGAGTVVLNAANTYQGTTTVSAGTLQISNENNLGANPGAFNAAQLSLNGGTLRSSGSAVVIDDANRGVTIGAAGGTFETDSNLTLATAVAGSGTLTKTGSGTLSLTSAANTHSGSVAIDAGTLAVSGGSAIGNASAVTVASGATFDLTAANETIGSLAGAGSVSLGTRTLSLGGDNTSTTYSGVASGTGGITKQGNGTLTLAGVNTYTGNTTISAGVVQLGVAGALANTSGVNLSGGTLAVGGNFSETAGTLTLSANSSIDFNNATSTLTFANATRTGGTLRVDDWAGSAFGGGSSRLVVTNPILPGSGFATGGNGEFTEINFTGWGSGAVRLPSGEIVPYTGGTVYTYVPSGSGTWVSSANWTPTGTPSTIGDTAILGSSIAADSTISLGAGNSTLGYLIVNNANRYTVQNSTLVFDVNAGQAQIVNQGAGGLTINSTISLNDALTLTQAGSGNVTLGNAINGTSRNITIAGSGAGVVTISGSINTTTGTLTKTGESTLVLSGTNTFTGNTTINGGVLAIRNENNLGANPGSFNATQLTLNGGTLRTEVAAVTINDANRGVTIGAAGGTFDTSSNLTIATAVAGSGSLTKTGDGTLSLTSTANTHSGSVAIDAGTLSISGGSAIGNNSTVTMAEGAGFTVNATETIGSLAGAGLLNLAAGTLTTGGNNNSTAFSGNITGPGALTKAGNGTFTLSGSSNYTGIVTVSTGTLVAASDSALGTTAAGTSITSGATLAITGGVNLGAEALTLRGTGVDNGGALRNLSGENSLGGPIGLATDSTIASDAGTLTLSGAIARSGGTNRALTTSGSGAIVISGNIANTITTLTKNGGGNLTLSGANSYTGLTSVTGGTLVISSNTALGATGSGTTVSNGTLALSGSGLSTAENLTLNGQGVDAAGALRNLAGNNTVSGTITLGSEVSVGANTGTSLTSSGVISGGFGLTKVGDGTLVLSAANIYTGTTAVNAGVLEVRNNSSLGTTGSPTTVATGAAVAFNGAALSVGENFTIAGDGGGDGALRAIGGSTNATISSGATVTLNGNAALGVASGSTLTIAGGIAEEAGADYGLTKVGDGTLVLGGINSYNGPTLVRAGTLRLDAPAPVSSNGALGSSSSVVQLGDASTGSSAIALLAGPTTLTVARDIAVNNFGSGTTLGGVNTSGTTTFSGAVTLSKDVSLTAASGGETVFSGAITGSGAVAKTGAGTVVLSGANTYVGATTVSQGTLVAANDSALGSAGAGTTVASGASLGLQNNVSIAESLTLNGGTLVNRADSNVYSGGISLGGSSTISNTAGTLDVTGVISGANALALNTSAGAITTLSGSNTYSGATTVSGAGVNILTGTLASTTSIQLNASSVLRLGGNDRINNSANLLLNGGTFALNGYSEGSTTTAGMNTLNLLANSTLDFTGDAASLRFANDARTTGNLTISGWAGDVFDGGGEHQLLISTNSTVIGIANINFEGWGTARLLDRGGGVFEILPTIAQTNIYRWDGTSGTAWNTGLNWTRGDGTAGLNDQPNTAGMIAIFGDLGQAVTNVDLAGTTRSLGRVYFENKDGTANNYTLGNGTLTLDGTGNTTAEIVVSDNVAPTINTNITAADNVRITNNSDGLLTLSSTGSSMNMAGFDLTVTGSGTTSIAKTISGNTTDLLKSGSGTLILSSANNSYGGNTTIANGVLQLNANALSGVNGALGNSTTAVVLNTSATTSSMNTSLLIGVAGVTVERAVTVDNFGATTTLGGVNTSGTSTFSGNITLNKDVSLSASANGTVAFTGVLSGVGGIAKVGNGTVQIAGNAPNSFTGDVAVNQGVLEITKSVSDGAINNAADVSVASGATLRLNNGQAETIGSLSGSGTVENTNATAVTLTIGGNPAASAYEFAGNITDGSAGNLAITKTGTGTFTLSGNNTFDGNVTVSQGTLVAASNTALGNTTGDTSVSSGATLALRNNITVGAGEALTLNTTSSSPSADSLRNLADSNTYQGPITLAGAAAGQAVRIGAVAGSTLNLSGAVGETGGAQGLIKTDTGTVVLSGANTYTGNTTVSAGTLVVANNAALGAATAGTSVSIGATLGFQGNVTVAAGESITLAGVVSPTSPSLRNLSGNNTVDSAITLTGGVNTGVRIDANSNSTLVLTGAITQATNNNAVTKTGGGQLTLSGSANNTFAGGLTINDGVVLAQKTAGVTATGNGEVFIGDSTGSANSAILRLGAANQIADTSDLTIRTDGQLDLQANNETVRAVTMNGGSVVGTGTLTLGNNLTFNGVGTATASVSSSVALGAASRIVQVGNNGLNGDSDMVVSGVISGSGQTLRKTDLGTLELAGSASNTFSGGLQIDDGVVLLNKGSGASAIGGGSVTIGDGLLGPGTATLRYGASNQLPDATDIAFNTDGRLDMNGKIDTIDEIDSAVAGAGQILIGTGQLIVGSNNGNSVYSGTLVGTTGGILEKIGTGTLTLSDADASRGDRVMDFGGELKLESGTLALDNITLNVDTLRLTGTSVIDFGGSSTLNVNKLIVELAAGETTTITSWAEFVDYFYAQSFTATDGGPNIPFDTRGQAPQNRIVFASWTGNNTWWQSWDKQVTPVPEPSAYGVLALGGLLGFNLTRRRRRA